MPVWSSEIQFRNSTLHTSHSTLHTERSEKLHTKLSLLAGVVFQKFGGGGLVDLAHRNASD